jgi:ornithine--oxo-acid transaminase
MDLLELEKHYCAPNYAPLPVMLSRGKGVWLWDVNGKKYLDMMSAYSAVSHGHSHPRILAALTQQAERLAVASRAFHADTLGPFLEKLCQLTGLDMACPMNTGAEAVETAIKVVRRWGNRIKKIPADRAEIIVAGGNFHGRTTTIVGFSDDESYRDGFGPFAAGFVRVPFGDAAALEKAITPNTCAVLIEPIQGEAGIVAPPAGFLRQLREMCDRHNVLLILDEIQSGIGRTGKWFAWQHEGIQPDGVCLGKALGGGMMPVSAFVGRRTLIELLTPGSHGSTFGGNALAAAVGLEALRVIEDEKLVERSAELGEFLIEQLRSIRSPLIKEVRGKGLWIGVEFDPHRVAAREVCVRLAKRGILTKETHETTVRLAPPLIITKAELQWALDELKQVIAEFEAEKIPQRMPAAAQVAAPVAVAAAH